MNRPYESGPTTMRRSDIVRMSLDGLARPVKNHVNKHSFINSTSAQTS